MMIQKEKSLHTAEINDGNYFSARWQIFVILLSRFSHYSLENLKASFFFIIKSLVANATMKKGNGFLVVVVQI